MGDVNRTWSSFANDLQQQPGWSDGNVFSAAAAEAADVAAAHAMMKRRREIDEWRAYVAMNSVHSDALQAGIMSAEAGESDLGARAAKMAKLQGYLSSPHHPLHALHQARYSQEQNQVHRHELNYNMLLDSQRDNMMLHPHAMTLNRFLPLPSQHPGGGGAHPVPWAELPGGYFGDPNDVRLPKALGVMPMSRDLRDSNAPCSSMPTGDMSFYGVHGGSAPPHINMSTTALPDFPLGRSRAAFESQVLAGGQPGGNGGGGLGGGVNVDGGAEGGDTAGRGTRDWQSNLVDAEGGGSLVGGSTGVSLDGVPVWAGLAGVTRHGATAASTAEAAALQQQISQRPSQQGQHHQ